MTDVNPFDFAPPRRYRPAPPGRSAVGIVAAVAGGIAILIGAVFVAMFAAAAVAIGVAMMAAFCATIEHVTTKHEDKKRKS